MNLAANFKGPLGEHMRMLEKLRSPISDLQRTLNEITEPHKRFKRQFEEVFGKYNRLQNSQLLEKQSLFENTQKELNIGFTGYDAVIKEFQEKNNKLLRSIGGVNSVFQLFNSYRDILRDFNSSIGAFYEFKNKQSAILSTIRFQENCIAKLNAISKISSIKDCSKNGFDAVDELFNEIENGLRFYVEGNRTEVCQLSIDQLLNYIGLFLNIIFFLFSTATADKTDRVINKNSEIGGRLEAKLKEISSRLDSIAQIQNKLELRICVHKCMVFRRPNTCSTTLGHVKENQLVNVISTEFQSRFEKWQYVTYVDFELGTPKAGWVIKRYFKPSERSNRSDEPC